jgi:UDP-glucose 4-epimerase
MENIDECIDINVQGTVNVLKSAKKNGLKRVLFSSSAAVYGDSPQVPKTEEMAPTPQSPYAITKLDGEYYGELFQRYFGVDTVCARFFNVFGERQDPQSSYAAAVPIFITRAIHDKSLTIYGDGNQTRDFIYVKDIVSALIYLMKTGNGVINIGYGKHITINDLVKTIKKIVNSKSSVHYEEKRPGEIEHSYASIHRLSSLGFQPAFSLEEGLRNTVNYYLQTASNERGQPG